MPKIQLYLAVALLGTANKTISQVTCLLISNYNNLASRFTAKLSLCLVLLVLFCGCGRGVHKAGISDLESEHSSFRALALCRVAQENNTEHLARQIELLADEDPAVRFYAIESLKKLTGTDNGYNYRQSSELRQVAIIRWQDWLAARSGNPELGGSQSGNGN